MSDLGQYPALSYDNAVDSAFRDVIHQYRNGVKNPVLIDDLPAVVIDAVVDRLTEILDEVLSPVHDPEKGVVVIEREFKEPDEATVAKNNPPRPCNAFILYRQFKHPEVLAENPGIKNCDISKVAGDMWRVESPECRAMWTAKADVAKEEHARLYPNYSYKPRKTREVKRRKTKSIAKKIAELARDEHQTQYQVGQGTSATNPHVMSMFPMQMEDPMMREFDLPTTTSGIEELADGVTRYNNIQGLCPALDHAVLETSFSNVTAAEFGADQEIVLDPLLACAVEEMQEILAANANLGNLLTNQVQVIDPLFARNFGFPRRTPAQALADDAEAAQLWDAEQLRQQRLHDEV